MADPIEALRQAAQDGHHHAPLFAMIVSRAQAWTENKLVQIVLGGAVMAVGSFLLMVYAVVPTMRADIDEMKIILKEVRAQNETLSMRLQEARHNTELSLTEIRFRVRSLEERNQRK